MDERLVKTIESVVKLTEKDAEFNKKIREALGVPSASSSLPIDERINQIYEYCLEDIIKNQAKDFYKDFPFDESVKNELIKDFVRMEFFRRKDNFGDFCLALYQQIECITNNLCRSKDISTITERMWGENAYLNPKGEFSISNRSQENKYSIASLVFMKKTERASTALQSLYAMDKVRTIIYFIGYKAMLRLNDYENFKEITSLISDIYQCRNLNHRGNNLYDWEQETLDRILPMKSLYYYKFMGALLQYVEFIRNGYPSIDEILKYAYSIQPKKIVPDNTPKVLGKIDVSNEKRRFKK